MLAPDIPVTRGADGYGNVTLEGTVADRHSVFSVSVQGTVEVPSSEPDLPVPEEQAADDDAMVYKYQTHRTEPGPAILDLLSSVQDCDCDDLSRAVGIMHRLHSRFKYQKGLTGPNTTAEEAAAGGAGVCQDYAHVFIALARIAGWHARYCMGLTVGEGATHAWAEIYYEGAWHGFDPTRDCRTDASYLRFATGRDAADCPVEQGTFYETQTVFMRVKEI